VTGKRIIGERREPKHYGVREGSRSKYKSSSPSLEVDLCNAIARCHRELTGKPIRLSKAKLAEYRAAGLDMSLFGERK
jgi:hypothetical protein